MKRLVTASVLALVLCVISAACEWDDCAMITESTDQTNARMMDVIDRQAAGDFSDPADYVEALTNFGDVLQAQWEAIGCGNRER